MLETRGCDSLNIRLIKLSCPFTIYFIIPNVNLSIELKYLTGGNIINMMSVRF